MSTILINKNNTNFYVTGDQTAWFIVAMNHGNWEEDTFNILDYYQDNNKTYIDIGAWIGPTVLYSANKYNNIICFEPDPVAHDILRKNIEINNFNNIKLINKAISNNNGISQFGGYGPLGNSCSSLLTGIKNIYDNYGDQQELVDVNTTTLESVIEENNIDPNNIGLIKMDIEGGEIIVLPNIKDFLLKYKPNFFISLHRGDEYLNNDQINFLINLLFDIYNNCYVYLDDKNELRKKIDRETALVEGNTLVFEK